MTALAVELQEGMKRVVAPVALLCTEMRSGWWTEASPCWLLVEDEYSCRAEARAFWKPCRSERVRFWRRVWI